MAFGVTNASGICHWLPHHRTEGDSSNGRAAVKAFEALRPDAAEFLFQKKHYYCTRLDASYRFLAEGDTLLNRTLLRILALLPVAKTTTLVFFRRHLTHVRDLWSPKRLECSVLLAVRFL